MKKFRFQLLSASTVVGLCTIGSIAFHLVRREASDPASVIIPPTLDYAVASTAGSSAAPALAKSESAGLQSTTAERRSPAERIKADLDVAILLASALPEEQREMAFARIGRLLAAKDPWGALSLAGYVPEGNRRDSFIEAVAHGWALANPPEAAAWAKKLESEKLRRKVQAAISIEWAQTAPAEAAKYVAFGMEPGAAQIAAATTVAVRWAAAAPREAAAWAERFPEGPARYEVRSAVTTLWASSDPVAARAWRLSLTTR